MRNRVKFKSPYLQSQTECFYLVHEVVIIIPIFLEVIIQDKSVILYEGKWVDLVREVFCKSCEGFADFS